MRRTCDPRHVFKHLQLDIEEFADSNIRSVAAHLFGIRITGAWAIYDDTVEAAPLVNHVLHVLRVDSTLRHKQHTLRRSPHYPVVHRDKTVCVTLLVDDISHEAMYLPIEEGIAFEYEGVSAIG